MGALGQVSKLPEDQIPSKCKHADILKIIMLNCKALSFKRTYSHVEAHKDDKMDFGMLSRPSQLNCACDYAAKSSTKPRPVRPTPTNETTAGGSQCLGRKGEISTDQVNRLRYYSHRQLAWEEFVTANICPTVNSIK